MAAAAAGRCLWRVLAPRRGAAAPGLQRCLPAAPPPRRPYAAAAAKTAKKSSHKPKQEETKKKKGTLRRLLMSKPVDDVYLTWCYERPSYDVEVAVGMLKKFQELDFTYPKQYVYVNITLDMALQKKKKVDPFASIVLLPYRFTDEMNKVLVFTENKEEAEIAQQNGAALVGGVELIKWILEDEIKVDFYVAVPEIMPKLIPLKSKLRRKYPSAKRNSMGCDIPKMLQLFKEGLEYAVEDEHLIKTRIARILNVEAYVSGKLFKEPFLKDSIYGQVEAPSLQCPEKEQDFHLDKDVWLIWLDMPTEQIVANLNAIIQDICTFKPSSYGPFVQKLVIRSSTSEGLLLNLDGLLPQVEKEEEEKNPEDEE